MADVDNLPQTGHCRLIANDELEEGEDYVRMVLEWTMKTVPQLLDPTNNSLLFLAKIANYTTHPTSH